MYFIEFCSIYIFVHSPQKCFVMLLCVCACSQYMYFIGVCSIYMHMCSFTSEMSGFCVHAVSTCISLEFVPLYIFVHSPQKCFVVCFCVCACSQSSDVSNTESATCSGGVSPAEPDQPFPQVVQPYFFSFVLFSTSVRFN